MTIRMILAANDFGRLAKRTKEAPYVSLGSCMQKLPDLGAELHYEVSAPRDLASDRLSCGKMPAGGFSNS